MKRQLCPTGLPADRGAIQNQYLRDKDSRGCNKKTAGQFLLPAVLAFQDIGILFILDQA